MEEDHGNTIEPSSKRKCAANSSFDPPSPRREGRYVDTALPCFTYWKTAPPSIASCAGTRCSDLRADFMADSDRCRRRCWRDCPGAARVDTALQQFPLWKTAPPSIATCAGTRCSAPRADFRVDSDRCRRDCPGAARLDGIDLHLL